MFNNIVGNEKVKEYLKTSVENNNISHSYMFIGKSSIGKKLFAREFAKKIMCLNLENSVASDKENTVKKLIKDENSAVSELYNKVEAGSDCESCIKFETGSNPDYSEIFPDGKTLKVEQIRKMQEKIAEKPIVSNRKVYVIDDADLMNEESQNCLLKTLEEPPRYAVIILIVSNESKILSTIKSRCILVKFNALSDNEIKAIIPNLSDDFVKILEGSLENSKNIEEKQEQYKQLNYIVDLIAKKCTLVELFNKSELLYSNKDDIMNMLEYMNVIFFEKKWINLVEIVEKTKQKLMSNNNYDMCIDYLLMHIWEEFNEKSYRS